jgi:hypothetical protein
MTHDPYDLLRLARRFRIVVCRLVSRYRCLLDPIVAPFCLLVVELVAIIKSLCLGVASV